MRPNTRTHVNLHHLRVKILSQALFLSRYFIQGIAGNFTRQGCAVLTVGQDDNAIPLPLIDAHPGVKIWIISVMPEEIPLRGMQDGHSQPPGLIILDLDLR
jgi:hypothetical protein